MTNLYREIIIDHWKNPRNFGHLPKPDSSSEGENPFCGDRIRIELKMKSGKLKEIKFSGEGCAISMASASMLTEEVKGKKIEDLKRLGKDDIVKMLGIELTPLRLKCALLPLEVLQKAVLEFKKEK